MAFDGITVACVVRELCEKLSGSRVYKITQPEKDELIMIFKQNKSQYKLLLSADSSLPLVYLTEDTKQAPLTAPVFCMLLRKHLQNAKVTGVSQPGMERAVELEFEHYDELGDLCRKTLVIEIMGKHSNIIFLNQSRIIIDSIKRIPSSVSSVREVLPGREYFIPDTMGKQNPREANIKTITDTFRAYKKNCSKAVYMSFTGISPLVAEEICYRAEIDAKKNIEDLTEDELVRMANAFYQMMRSINENEFEPVIIFDGKKPSEFCAVLLTSYPNESIVSIPSISELLQRFYSEKNRQTRVRQRSSELRHIVATNLERNVKKLDLQNAQKEDTKNRDQFRIYGELLNAYGYGITEGTTSVILDNYYTGGTEEIALDPRYSVRENAKRYFDKYQKLKRTYEALIQFIEETASEVVYLESVQVFLEQASGEEDLNQIREELIQNGYIKKKSGVKAKRAVSKPASYRSSDGFEILVGRNNIQNEELTFKVANGNDWWFHAKGIPGSHVILRTDGREIPDLAFEEAAGLAAHYSKGRDQDKVLVDYTQRKNVKKVAGAKTGFVIYHTNYSMVADTGTVLPPFMGK